METQLTVIFVASHWQMPQIPFQKLFKGRWHHKWLMAPLMWNTKIKQENRFNLTYEWPDKLATHLQTQTIFNDVTRNDGGKDLWKYSLPSNNKAGVKRYHNHVFFLNLRKLRRGFQQWNHTWTMVRILLSICLQPILPTNPLLGSMAPWRAMAFYQGLPTACEPLQLLQSLLPRKQPLFGMCACNSWLG